MQQGCCRPAGADLRGSSYHSTFALTPKFSRSDAGRREQGRRTGAGTGAGAGAEPGAGAAHPKPTRSWGIPPLRGRLHPMSIACGASNPAPESVPARSSGLPLRSRDMVPMPKPEAILAKCRRHEVKGRGHSQRAGSSRRRGDGMSSGSEGAADCAISAAAVDPISLVRMS